MYTTNNYLFHFSCLISFGTTQSTTQLLKLHRLLQILSLQFENRSRHINFSFIVNTLIIFNSDFLIKMPKHSANNYRIQIQRSDKTILILILLTRFTGRIQNMDPGPWTTPVDPVHGPPHGPGPWTTSVDPVHGPPPAEPVFHCIHVHGNRQTQTMDPGLWTTL